MLRVTACLVWNSVEFGGHKTDLLSTPGLLSHSMGLCLVFPAWRSSASVMFRKFRWYILSDFMNDGYEATAWKSAPETAPRL